MWGLFKMEEICNVCGFIEKDHVNSVHAFIKITKEAKTPNYPKEIEAKMTKEKPLSEKAWEGKYGIHDKHYTKEDVAEAVRRLKEEVKIGRMWGYKLINKIEEIFGEFK